MSEGLNQILDHSGCLSEEQLLAYLRGGLSDEDRHAVELHLADCAFCSEAMEGLAAMEDRDMVPLVVKQIQQQLHHELQAHQLKHKKLKTYIWLSAAVVALLLILLFAYFVVNQRMREERQPSSPPAHTHVQAGRSPGDNASFLTLQVHETLAAAYPDDSLIQGGPGPRPGLALGAVAP